MLNIKALRNIKKNSDIENILTDSYDYYNIISREKLQKNFNEETGTENRPKLPISLFRNKNTNSYKDLKVRSLQKYKTIKTTQINLPKNKNKSNKNEANINTTRQTKSFTLANLKTDKKIKESKNVNSMSASKTGFISKKNFKVSFGKSLNQVLINNIKNAIKSRGNTNQKIKRKKFSSIIYKTSYANKNKNNLYKTIFDDKLAEIYENYQNRQKLYKKLKIDKLMSSYEKKKLESRNSIPLSIRGYNKKKLDIFYTRNVCDLDYQRYYHKSQLNIEDVLENHNKYNRKEYLSGNIPFYLLTKTVYKPMFRKSTPLKRTPIKFTKNIKTFSL